MRKHRILLLLIVGTVMLTFLGCSSESARGKNSNSITFENDRDANSDENLPETDEPADIWNTSSSVNMYYRDAPVGYRMEFPENEKREFTISVLAEFDGPETELLTRVFVIQDGKPVDFEWDNEKSTNCYYDFVLETGKNSNHNIAFDMNSSLHSVFVYLDIYTDYKPKESDKIFNMALGYNIYNESLDKSALPETFLGESYLAAGGDFFESDFGNDEYVDNYGYLSDDHRNKYVDLNRDLFLKCCYKTNEKWYVMLECDGEFIPAFDDGCYGIVSCANGTEVFQKRIDNSLFEKGEHVIKVIGFPFWLGENVETEPLFNMSETIFARK